MEIAKPVVIIGAGISGLQAAIELADCGIEVYLIERKPYAGGNAQNLYKFFPTDDCAFCIGATTLKPGIRKCFYRAGIEKHPRINLLLNCEIKKIVGSVGHFTVEFIQYPRFVSKDCTRCGKCEEVCPVQVVPNNWTELPRKAIYLPSKMCIPQTYVIDRERCDPNCQECIKACPFEGVINLNDGPKEVRLEATALLVATGFREFNPSAIINLKYGNYQDVITQVELARMLDPNGPSNGRIIRPSTGEPVKNLVMIQCVGSRDENFQKYCSTICCSYACKHARIIKQERHPEMNLFLIYMDVRTFGKLEYYYRECRELGIDFLRGRIAEILLDKDKKLRVRGIDTLLQQAFELTAELIVLTPALIPGNENITPLKDVGLEFDENGFISVKMGDRTITNVKGIYACGTAVAPMDIPHSISLAKSAACNIIKLIQRGAINS
ncbi:MAG: FAD-dependent oxidoreductase [Candidatus Helarchaeota archaeon]